jgi:hypothetical protein
LRRRDLRRRLLLNASLRGWRLLSNAATIVVVVVVVVVDDGGWLILYYLWRCGEKSVFLRGVLVATLLCSHVKS